MGNIVNDAIDYDSKINLIRVYSSRYSSDDFERLFGTSSLAEILENYTYSIIRSRLVNSISNTLDGDIEIGDMVTVDKPSKLNSEYVKRSGLVIGKYIIYDEYNNNVNPIYHYQYDILIQNEYYTNGYQYEIVRESAYYLIKTDIHIENVDKVMQELSFNTVKVNT